MSVPQINFDVNDIKLNCIYQNSLQGEYHNTGIDSKKVERVYGKLKFQTSFSDRPITYASYVMSIDGKIAYLDNEVGPLIAKNNYLDKNGAFADFWVLNMLRANCDGIIIGSGTLIKEPEYSGSAYDPDLLNDRLSSGKEKAPWTVIVTRTGMNIPFQNNVFRYEEVPVLIATSPKGLKNLLKEIPTDYYFLPRAENENDIEQIKRLTKENRKSRKIAILVTGDDEETDTEEMLCVLKVMGMDKVLVESPTYCHHLMKQGLLDEIFINTSCVFVGGQATGIGTLSQSFSSLEHPHCEILSIHMHSPHFMYTRYRMIYQIKK